MSISDLLPEGFEEKKKNESNHKSERPEFLDYVPKVFRKPKDPTPSVGRNGDSFRVVVFPDTHVPRQDKRAWNTALGLTKDFKPHALVIIGDFADFESVSHHPKNRPDITKFATECYETNLALDAVQEASGGCDAYYVEGNHEYRAVKYVNAFPHLDGLLNVPQNLFITPPGLPPSDAGKRYFANRINVNLRGITWLPFRKYLRRAWKSPWGCGYMHSAKGNGSWGSGGVNHASYHANNVGPVSDCNLIVYGHHHSFQYFRSPAGYEAQCAGFLGDYDADEPAFDYAAGPSPWVTGMLLQEFKSGLSFTEQVYIKNGKALFRGRIFG